MHLTSPSRATASPMSTGHASACNDAGCATRDLRRRLEACARHRSLTGAALVMLLDMAGTAEVLLNLSEVREADTDAVRVLARLGPGACLLA